MKNEASFREKLSYAIDNTFSRGTRALIGWLAAASGILIAIVALFVAISGVAPEGEEAMDFIEAFWRTLMRTLDAGTMGGDTGWGFRLLMFIATVGGIFIISTLIGILTSAVEGKLEELRKGRSRVIENNHTVILGWSEQIFTIIPELVAANENQKNSCIVVLGNHDKVEMEDEIQQKAGALGSTRVVCRSGNPIEMSDLRLASLNTSRSIIILSPENSGDAEVIKTVLAITNAPDRRSAPYHIVAELRDTKNFEVAKVVGKDEVEWIQVGNLVARVIAQTCRQSGLSQVYDELLNFGGDEIYLSATAELFGKSYAETLAHFEKNAVMGICPAGGVPQLNPPMETVLKKGDRLIILAEDDHKILYQASSPAAQEKAIKAYHAPAARPESTLVLGWNWRGRSILSELNQYVPAGSQALIVANPDCLDAELNEQVQDLKLSRMELKTLTGDATDRRTLEALDVASYDHIIVLSYSEAVDPQVADSMTLMTLLHLRDMSDKSHKDFSIVSEMLDVRNRNLAEVTRADDFIVSNRLTSLMLAQVSEEKALNGVFADLFDPEGAEIYLKPAAIFVETGQALDFYTVLEAARRSGQTAIGYRQEQFSHNAEKSYGVVLNPAKSAKITFQPDDKIIVLANE